MKDFKGKLQIIKIEFLLNLRNTHIRRMIGVKLSSCTSFLVKNFILIFDLFLHLESPRHRSYHAVCNSRNRGTIGQSAIKNKFERGK